MLKSYIFFWTLCCISGVYGQPGRGIGTRSVEKRVAFVIGNGAYRSGSIEPLTNPTNDADSMKKVLEFLNFTVHFRKNATKTELLDGLKAFKNEIQVLKNQKYRVVALLYYAGHGVRWQRDEQFIPIDAHDLQDTTSYVHVEPIWTDLKALKSDVNIFIFDACREKVYGNSRNMLFKSGTPLVVRPNQPASGSFFAYATAIGAQALDGNQRNSPFTTALLHAIRIPNMPLEMTFDSVKNELGNKQIIGIYSELIGLFCFNPSKIVDPSSPPTKPVPAVVRRDHQNTVRSTAFTKNETCLLTGSWDNTLICYELRNGNRIRFQISNGPYNDHVTSVSISPDDQYFAVTSTDSTTKLYRLSNGERIHTWGVHPHIMMTAQFSPDGNYLATAGKDPLVFLYRMSDFQLERTFDDHTEGVHQLRFSPNGSFLATASVDHTVHLYKIADFSLAHTFDDHTDGVNSVSFSPNGKYLATGGVDKKVHLYRVSDKKLLHTFNDHMETIYTICFSHDNELLATAGEDKTVKIYALRNWQLLQSIEEHSDWIYQVCFSPSGRYLVTASKDISLRMYQKW